MNRDDIRKTFLDFFTEKGHTIVKSSPVVPHDDPTLLFANAGMNQFKDIFLGKKGSTFRRAASTQKCIRVSGKHNDLEEVGRDGYHHTFFEMLGNWSFGDYFKKEAIEWGWELLTERYGIDKERLYVSVFGGDQSDGLPEDKEAFDFWSNILPKDRIIFGSKKDNFWEMGDTGPCGPCSEIHIDIRPDAERDKVSGASLVNMDHPLVIEIWNLVFMEFFRQDDGSLIKLPMQSVDTGMGFERLCSVLQDTRGNNYLTDVFMPIIDKLAELSGHPFNSNDNPAPFYVVADHIRTLSFAIADGALPSNDGRGYVLRRILRRAARFLREIGVREPILYRLSSTVIDQMGDTFPELLDKGQLIATVIKGEEERFLETLDTGLKYFDKITESLSPGDMLKGEDVFRLYDTYGFPIDLTALIAADRELQMDTEGFNRELEMQREKARRGAGFKGEVTLGRDEEWTELSNEPDSEFTGYRPAHELSEQTRILRYRFLDDGRIVVVLSRTPFYAESGGQIGDRGTARGKGFEINITDTVKDGGTFLHIGTLKGKIESPEVEVCVEDTLRRDIARNHTATHLLHAALRQIIGDHARQSGSHVGPDRLRFDYTHFEKPTHEQLLEIERNVNLEITKNYPVQTEQDQYENALKKGVTALFGEKYEDVVRIVSIGDVSHELCGGTHVERTGDIGAFVIMAEESVGSGTRRIEAVTGSEAIRNIQITRTRLDEARELLKTSSDMLPKKIDELLKENKDLKYMLKEKEKEQDLKKARNLTGSSEKIGELSFIADSMDFASAKDMAEVADKLLADIAPGVVVLISGFDNNKVGIVITVSKEIAGKTIHAGNLIRETAQILGGGGGGRPDFAQAGGKDISRIPDALEFVRDHLRNNLKEQI